MSNTSGRITELKTELHFPIGELWLKDQRNNYSKGTAKRKRIALEQFDEYLITEHEVTDKDIFDSFYKFLKSIYSHKDSTIEKGNELLYRFSEWLDDVKGLSHSTIPHRFYGVREYLNEYVTTDDDFELGFTDDDDDYILDWLKKGTKTNREIGERAHWLDIDNIEKLIDNAKNLKNRLVIELLWNTGCRPSEISRMRVENTYPEERRIYVKTSKVDDPEADVYRRDVFWSRSMDRTMREWLDRGGRKSYAGHDESPYLVVGYNSPSLQARQINQIVKDTAERAGIQKDNIATAMEDGNDDTVATNRVTPKTLRHSFAIWSVRGRERSGSPSIDIERLRRLMGHTSLASTRFYLRFTSDDLRDAFDKSHPA